MSRTAFTAYLIGLLDANEETGRAKLQAILEAAAAKTGTTDNDKLTRNFPRWFDTTDAFTKTDVGKKLTPLVTSNIITAPQRTAVLNNWPEF